MKITEARKKIKYCNALLQEYGTIKSTLNAIHRMDEDQDYPTCNKEYTANLAKRLITIESTFDKLLK